MKINIKIWALSYASIDSDDELYVDTIGTFDTYESAEKAMEDNILIMYSEIKKLEKFYGYMKLILTLLIYIKNLLQLVKI